MNIAAVTQVQARMDQIAARFDAGSSFAAALSSAQSTVAPQTATNGTVHAPAATTATADADAPAQRWAHKLPAAAQQWVPHIEQAARRHGLDPRLLAALVKQESGFRADAGSHAGAIGLTQLMPGTARELGVDPHDPIANLDGGARYLSQQLDRFGSVPLALAAYNAGPGRVAAAGGIPQISETQRYVRNVSSFYADLGGRA